MKFPFRSFQRFLSRHPRLSSALTLCAPVLGFASAAAAQNAAGAAPVAAQISPLEATILGLVQGLTEFIPISSSGHLNIVHAMMGHPRKLDFDIFISLGTTAALAWYFRHDWKNLISNRKDAALRNLVLLACVPAVAVGLSIRHLEDNPPFSDPRFNALCMIAAGLVLFWADRAGRKERTLEAVNTKDALIVGLSQAAALVPGISRSGATLTAGLFLGLRREDAARFSFLMSLPISLGVNIYSLYGLTKPGTPPIGAGPLALSLGLISSAVSGFWAITFLLNYLKTRDVTPFVIWRVAFGLFALAYFSAKAGQ